MLPAVLLLLENAQLMVSILLRPSPALHIRRLATKLRHTKSYSAVSHFSLNSVEARLLLIFSKQLDLMPVLFPEFAPMPVTMLVSRESGLQPLEETITLCTEQEFQEYLDNEDSYLFDETNKKVVWLSCMRNNQRYRLERKQGAIVSPNFLIR